MKKSILGFLAIVMIVGFSANVMAQTTATAVDGTATATIIAPIGITAVNDLAFGNIIEGAGTVTVDLSSVSTYSVPELKPASQIGTIQSATFAVTGQGAYSYAITLPADEVVTIAETGLETMAVNGFLSNPSGTGTLTAGAGTIIVGATLTVVDGQTAGDYTGAFSVTVAYN